MVIQGTQVPMYTKHTLFLYFFFFSDFSIFFKIFYMKNKAKQNWKITKQKHVKQNKALHKTRLTLNNKLKHTSNAKQKQEGEREKVT